MPLFRIPAAYAESAAQTFNSTPTIERNASDHSLTLLPYPQRRRWFGVGGGRRQARFSLASSGSPVRSDEADSHATPDLTLPHTKSEPSGLRSQPPEHLSQH